MNKYLEDFIGGCLTVFVILLFDDTYNVGMQILFVVLGGGFFIGVSILGRKIGLSLWKNKEKGKKTAREQALLAQTNELQHRIEEMEEILRKNNLVE